MKTDLVKMRDVVGKKIVDIKVEDQGRQLWLEFEDGDRLVFRVKNCNDGHLYSEEIIVAIHNDIVHQHLIFEIDLSIIQPRH